MSENHIKLLNDVQDAKQLCRLRRVERNIFANISIDDLTQIWQRYDFSSLKTIAIMNRFLSFWRRWNALILHYNLDAKSEECLKLLITMQDVQQLHKQKHFEMSRLIVEQIFLIENSYFQLMKIIDFKKYEDKIDQNFFRSIIRVKRIYWTFFYKMCFIFITWNKRRWRSCENDNWKIHAFNITIDCSTNSALRIRIFNFENFEIRKFDWRNAQCRKEIRIEFECKKSKNQNWIFQCNHERRCCEEEWWCKTRIRNSII